MAFISPAVIASVENLADGDVRIYLQFNGDAGEAPVRKAYIVGDTTTIADVRRFVYATIRQLNGRRTLAPVQGQNVPELAPLAAPAPTAKQVWQEKVGRYQRYQSVGLTGAGATELAAMLTDINNTYQVGFLDA